MKQIMKIVTFIHRSFHFTFLVLSLVVLLGVTQGRGMENENANFESEQALSSDDRRNPLLNLVSRVHNSIKDSEERLENLGEKVTTYVNSIPSNSDTTGNNVVHSQQILNPNTPAILIDPSEKKESEPSIGQIVISAINSFQSTMAHLQKDVINLQELQLLLLKLSEKLDTKIQSQQDAIASVSKNTLANQQEIKQHSDQLTNYLEYIINVNTTLVGLGEKVEMILKSKVMARDCAEVQSMGNTKSGEYTIYPIPGKPIQVQCDMDTNGGGWTIIQRRGQPLLDNEIREDFYRGWQFYETGFGMINKDYWLGLANIAALSQLGDAELRITLMDWEGEVRYANYNIFRVASSADLYRLTIEEYSGNATDSFSSHSGGAFTTYDKDNDTWDKNCAETFKGGWWYKACHSSNLNGLYAKDGTNGVQTDYATGIVWNSWKGHYYSLKMVEMKIRSRYLKT